MFNLLGKVDKTQIQDDEAKAAADSGERYTTLHCHAVSVIAAKLRGFKGRKSENQQKILPLFSQGKKSEA